MGEVRDYMKQRGQDDIFVAIFGLRDDRGEASEENGE